MIFDHIETLKQKYTDKYVLVDEGRPELRRFRGLTGTVRTVNMSGRALVEFDGFNNIGWYDIDLAYLKVIDAPLPKAEEKPAKKAKEAAPPKAEKPATPAKPAAAPATAKPAAPAPAAGGGKSVAEILAAARSKPTGAAPVAAAAPVAEAPAAKPAAAPAAAPAAKVPAGGKGMSMADILAAARGNKPAAAATTAAAAPAAAPPAAKAEAPPAAPQESAPAAEEPVVKAEAPAAAAPASGGKSLKDQITSVADQVAYCRKTDAKS
jgi:hypothetical protein